MISSICIYRNGKNICSHGLTLFIYLYYFYILSPLYIYSSFLFLFSFISFRLYLWYIRVFVAVDAESLLTTTTTTTWFIPVVIVQYSIHTTGRKLSIIISSSINLICCSPSHCLCAFDRSFVGVLSVNLIHISTASSSLNIPDPPKKMSILFLKSNISNSF